MDTAPKYIFLTVLVLVVGGLVAFIGFHQKSLPPEPALKGAGSTFVDPLMVQWSAEYAKTKSGFLIGYGSFGSGRGIQMFIDKQIDFACSDAPLTDDQMAKARSNGRQVAHIPLVLGAVVPVYNLPSVKAPLRFTGQALADIFLGKIIRWNDPALRELNPETDLPDQAIQVVHRSDGSGTTYIWVDYLSKCSPTWKKDIGVGTDVKWPIGAAESGNEGVAAYVKKTPASIGYVELTYAYRLDLAYGLVRNREMEFIKASLPSVTKAAENALAVIPDDLRFSLTDAPGKGSYPIAGTTWALVDLQQPAPKAGELRDFLNWATGNGQNRVEVLLYARLPDPLIDKAQKKIAQIQ